MFEPATDLFKEQRAPVREHVPTGELVRAWENHAKATPEKIAIQELDNEGQSWTWLALAQEAHLMAATMKAVGVCQGARIALMGPAGAQWVAAVWATWICEGVWCPLPDSIPAARRADMLQELDPQAIWTQGGIQGQGSERVKCPQGSAYITYTSGSTGRPKGVLVSSDGLLDLWKAQIELFGTTEHSKVAWMLSPAFDASISDVGVALTAGATLFPVPKGRWMRFKRWQTDMDRFCIDQVDAPPSWLALWSHLPPPTSLRTIIAGGEPTPSSILHAWSPLVRWVNVYGPTEATVCTSAEIRRLFPDDVATSTLGTPLPGVLYRIVPKDAQQPTLFLDGSECHEGELWIGGRAVALGYWKDPVRSKERFFEHEGTRWFRTGDAVRLEGDQWVFLGRIDRQVKMRGQLLHLDETETVLASMPGVAVCVAGLDANEKLVAVVPDNAPSIEDLRQWAAARLPAWGIPQRFVRIEQWPVTSTGKVNRKEVEAMIAEAAEECNANARRTTR